MKLIDKSSLLTEIEKECFKYFEDNDLCVHDEYIKFAMHFFELGLKAQKG